MRWRTKGRIQLGSGSAIDIVALSPDGRRLAVAQVSSLRRMGRRERRPAGFIGVLFRKTTISYLMPAASPPSPFRRKGVISPAGGWIKPSRYGMSKRKPRSWIATFSTTSKRWHGLPMAAAWRPGSADGRIIVWTTPRAGKRPVFEGHRNGSVIALDLRARREPYRYFGHRRLGQGLERRNGRATLRIAGTCGTGFSL